MAQYRFYLSIIAITLLINVLYAERFRYDDIEDDDFINDERDDVIETFKRFLLGKKTTKTTAKPNSDAISALITTTQPSRTLSTSSRSSLFGDTFGKDSQTTKSRFGQTRATTSSPKEACGLSNPCKNGGTCKTLSSGRYYCFCSQDYYGKNCENKFISTGAENRDRAPKDHCIKSPCRNGGECVGLRTTYYCRCKSPYYGTNCDKKIGKREEFIDESNSSEQELTAYERDLQEDNEDLRQALGEQYYQ